MKTHPSIALLLSLVTVGAGATAVSAQSIRGRVVDPEGRPVVGARVCLVEQEQALGLRANLVEPVPISRAKTSAKGTFALDASRAVADTPHRVWITSDRFADTTISNLHPAGAPELRLGKIALGAGSVVEGTVRDKDGNPIAGAEIQIVPARGKAALSPDRHAGWTGRTDPRGAFRIGNAGSGPVGVTAIYQGFVAVTRELRGTNGAPRRADIVLDRPGRSVSGIVVDDADRPLPGVQLRFTTPDLFAGRDPRDTRYQIVTLSAADGRFHLHGVPRRAIEVEARKPGFAKVFAHRIGVREGTTRITMATALTAHLRVRTPGGDAPAKIRVQLIYAKTETNLTPFRIPAIRDGLAVIDNLPPGRYRFDIRSKGYAQHLTQPFDLEPGKPAPVVDATLSVGGTVTGKLVDARGTPIAGAEVSVIPRTTSAIKAPPAFVKMMIAGGRPQLARLRTDETGRFRFEHLRAATYDLRVEHAEHGAQNYEVDVGDGTTRSLKALNLLAGVELEGTCKDGAGKPLVGARVMLHAKKTGARSEVTTDAKGRFRFPRRALPGDYEVMCAPRSDNPFLMIQELAASKKEFTVKAGARSPMQIELSTKK